MDNIVKDEEFIAIAKKLAYKKAEDMVEEVGLKYSADEVNMTYIFYKSILKEDYDIELDEEEDLYL